MKYPELIGQMTLAEKCALLSGKDMWHTREIARLGVPAITLSDGPGGLRKQAGKGDHLGLNASSKATSIPSASTLANSWDPELLEQMGKIVGSEAADQDVQVLLGPGLNIKRNPLCGRNFEYYSEDPYLCGKLAASFIRGVQSQGVAACAKHLAVNSQETRRMHNDSVVDERALREIYLTGFEIAVKEGKPQTVMTAYNKVNGTYANENTHLVQDILRGEWLFNGAVVTDWGGSNDYVEGIRAGMNLEMPAAGDDSAVQLMNAIGEGRILESLVDERVDQLLELILTATKAKRAIHVDTNAHHQFAAKAAVDSIVLLKNERGILPITRSSHVAIIGDFAQNPHFQGAGSSMVNAAKVDQTLRLLPDHFPNAVGFAQGFRRLDEEDEALALQAEELAREAACVLLYLGLTECFETEGLDRINMSLPQNQINLLKRISAVNPHIIVVLSAGSSVEMPWLPHCEALVYGGLGGQAGVNAMLRMLSGQVCPGGKLAETFPIRWEDVPSSQYYPGMEITSEFRESLFVGYRAFETAGIPVQFPFGFGLSYTAFSYSALEVSDRYVSFDITNIGDCAGTEIAQLYISLPGAKIFRPKQELKGFVKVRLAPGETRRVTIAFDDKTFRYFNVKTDRFEVEGGAYAVQIGASVKDLRLMGTLEVKGTRAPNPYIELVLSCYETCCLGQIPDNQFSALLGRAIPEARWDTKAPLCMNDTVSQLFYAKNPLARLMYVIFTKKVGKCIAKGKPDLNLLFIYNIPFRGIAKMMNGMVSMRMTEAILFMANGHFFRGLGRLIYGYFHRPNLQKAFKEVNRPCSRLTRKTSRSLRRNLDR